MHFHFPLFPAPLWKSAIRGVDITGNLFRLFKIVESATFDTAVSVAVPGNYSTNVSIPLLLSSI